MVFIVCLQAVLSDAWVVPLNELGQDDKQLHCRTHLGHILKNGDTAFGFNFKSANLNDSNFDLLKPSNIPDVVSFVACCIVASPDKNSTPFFLYTLGVCMYQKKTAA